MTFIFVPHPRFRIHHNGCFGTPRLVPLLRTEEMERESIEEGCGRLWRVCLSTTGGLIIMFFHRCHACTTFNTAILQRPYRLLSSWGNDHLTNQT
jgi:hypothetical protein